MAQLRAKPPVLEPNRFRALIYGDRGTGKTHLCCSIPSTYYIDTEGLQKYKKFVNMLTQNKSELISLPELSDIIKEVKTLLSVKHDYKTLVIDSLSFPYGLLANMEADRLIDSSTKQIEGTEFGANLAKPKRLTFHLGMLLTRLDMNVIVVAHEKSKYEKNQEVGKSPDVNEKMAYALGTVINIRQQGDSIKGLVEKTRYDEIKTSELIDFTDGYGTLKAKFGEDVFLRQSQVEVLATREQVEELNRLIALLKTPDEVVQKWKIASKATCFDEMNTKHIQACIDKLIKETKGENQ